ncbi:hypothetical protein AXA44_48070 [Rhodococcus sp. SC4]|nr:hypothetical protein AXA44_48070 [Rhodococcus sp. SC4]
MVGEGGERFGPQVGDVVDIGRGKHTGGVGPRRRQPCSALRDDRRGIDCQDRGSGKVRIGVPAEIHIRHRRPARLRT